MDTLIDAGWTSERIARLKELWPRNLSCAKIAAELGGGLSRNAVIGKAKRMGLPRRAPVPPPKPKKREGSSRQAARFVGQATARERAPAVSVIDAAIPQEQRKTFLELENHHCRWPVGDPGEPGFFFCGSPTADLEAGRPYCAAHHAVAFVPNEPERVATPRPSSSPDQVRGRLFETRPRNAVGEVSVARQGAPQDEDGRNIRAGQKPHNQPHPEEARSAVIASRL